MANDDRSEHQVVIFMARHRDAALTREFLGEGGVAAVVCASFQDLLRELEQPLGLLMLTEDVLTPERCRQLSAALDRQPPWSDVPLVLFAGRKHESADQLLGHGRANITIVEPPVRVSTVLSATHTALRARRRQYEVRDLLDQQREFVRRLELADRRKDEFLAMLGHELRNPLGAIYNGIHLLTNKSLPSDCRRPLEIVERQANNLGRIVDDLLDISRVTLGKIRLEPQKVDLCQTVQRCVSALAAEVTRAHHALLVELPEQPVWVLGDVVRLEQVLSNLLTNAIKYTPPHGRICVRLEATNGRAELEVKDHGIGIKADVLPTIFELFTQSEQGLDRSRGGLGLGLALVRRLVEMHQGTITADSDGPNTGSRFVVSLPLVANDELEPGEESASGPDAKLRILVVDDNEDARVLLSEVLEQWGHDVESAGDGLSGLDRACATCFDVALLDIGLPGMDGYELARRVRTRMDERCPRLYAMTGYGQPEDRARALAAGFDGHLVKPLDFAKLKRLLVEP